MFPKLYSATGFFLLFTQVAILGLMVYARFRYPKLPYFGNAADFPTGYEKYFTLLQILLFSTFLLVFIWAIFTPFAVLWNRRSRVKEEKTDLVKGAVGFVLAIALLLIDPFGIFRYFTTA